MGLLYTKQYLDFEPDTWKQISNKPDFESIVDNATLEILDISNKQHKLTFRKGGKITVLRTVGKFRLLWDNDDVT